MKFSMPGRPTTSRTKNLRSASRFPKAKLNTSLLRSSRGLAAIDIVLVVIILVSVGVIAQRILFHRKPPAPTPAVVQNSQTPPAAAAATPAPRPEFNDAEWTRLMADPVMKSHIVKRSQACAPNQSAEPGIGINPDNYAERAPLGGWRTWIVHKRIPCLESGMSILIVDFDRRPVGQATLVHGSVKVDQIVELPLNEFPQAIFDQYQTRKADAIEAAKLKGTRGASGRETIIRVSDLVPAPPQKSPPLALPVGRVLKKSELGILPKDKIHLVDVRSPEEFRLGTIPGAINVPFGDSNPSAAVFSPTIKNSELAKFNFDTNGLQAHRMSTIVLVGKSAQDPRPLWAALVLFDLGFRDINWIYDGAGATP